MKIRTTIKKTLTFLLPEIQLIQLVRSRGFINRRPVSGNPAGQAQTAGRQHTGGVQTHPAGLQTSLPGGYVQHPHNQPQRRDEEAARNALGAAELDRIFEQAERVVNRHVLGQGPFVRNLLAAYKQGYLQGRKNKARNVILVAGNAGTGKKTAVEWLVNDLHASKLSSTPHLRDIDLSRYEADEISGNFIQDMAAAFQEPEGTVMFRGFKEANPAVLSLVAKLAADGSVRTKEGVRINAADYFLLFYLDGRVNDGSPSDTIPSELTGEISAPVLQCIQAAAISSSIDEAAMRQITRMLVGQAVEEWSASTQTAISVQPEVYAALAGIAIKENRYAEAVQNWIEEELVIVLSGLRAKNELRYGDNVRIEYSDETFYVAAESIRVPVKAQTFIREETLEDIMHELDALIGLEPVKSFVHELMETVRVNKLRSREGLNSMVMALHMVFTGNPGTGKTTMARLVARILKSLGLLSQGQLVEVARQDLVGQYVGSTAPKTMAKVTEALGGVLFIDEAYTLARHDHDTFGLEAIDTIVKAMEDHRDNLVVVLAGYTQEMEVFLRSNPGLRSRFPFIVEFPDYKPDDMLQIMLNMAGANGFRIEDNSHKGLLELFEQKQIPGRNDSGNGRLVRNLFEEAVRKQSTRIAGLRAGEHSDLQLLTGADFGIGEREAFNIEKELAGIVGLDQVKTFVRTLEKQLIVDRRRKEAGIQVDTGQSLNMIFSGNPGTGKTTMARLLASMLKSMGYLKQGHLVEVDRSDLVAEYVGQTAAKTKVVVESALGGVLFIDEAYALAQDGVQGGGFGREAIDTLVRLIELHKGNLVVILAGYTEDMRKFVQVNAGMASRFPLQIEFPDYSPEEMQLIATIMAKGRGFSLAAEAASLLTAHFRERQIPGKKDGGNGRMVRNTLEEAIRKQAERLAGQSELTAEQLTELTADDFGLADELAAGADGSSALGELDNVVGLASVKEFVRSLSAQIEVAKRREQLGLPKASAQTLHMVFKGNPGTGKTMIARILARRFKELGVIKTDILVETDRSGLVAGYVGQTALKTREVIERALGGVLFVDEAYALAEGDQFGQEAIDTLVKAMDDYRDRLIVILAGYDEDMERFLDRNAGLRSRFPNIILFADYSTEEMLHIASLMLNSQGYELDSRAKAKLYAVCKTYQGDRTAGNGRLVRNLVEKAIRKHALRLSQKADAAAEELSMLTLEDIEG
ncbi:stage V sporulation protein K [Paenibacillus sambharensis]|uniref:Stage V sporulation protein K n=1 Tax=Paenibacillus sambharensis TaxID=1803190 RepID=A0A2W1LRU9_9BACL|nr:AAA family ATPase [Paenibacillus sambharensis]PZD97505.1 stage V sporulation protein K [Paenibacillus sambharensis]